MRTAFVILALFGVAVCARGELVNGIYVIVNDAVITYQDVEDSIRPLVRNLTVSLRELFRTQPG